MSTWIKHSFCNNAAFKYILLTGHSPCRVTSPQFNNTLTVPKENYFRPCRCCHPGVSWAVQPRSTPSSSLTSLSTASPWATSLSSCLQMKFQRQKKTFMLRALGRKDLVIQIPPFTEDFQALYAKVVTSDAVIAPVAMPSLGRNSWWEFHPEAYRPCDLIHGKCWP